jgi:hypothetical protein
MASSARLADWNVGRRAFVAQRCYGRSIAAPPGSAMRTACETWPPATVASLSDEPNGGRQVASSKASRGEEGTGEGRSISGAALSIVDPTTVGPLTTDTSSSHRRSVFGVATAQLPCIIRARTRHRAAEDRWLIAAATAASSHV